MEPFSTNTFPFTTERSKPKGKTKKKETKQAEATADLSTVFNE